HHNHEGPDNCSREKGVELVGRKSGDIEYRNATAQQNLPEGIHLAGHPQARYKKEESDAQPDRTANGRDEPALINRIFEQKGYSNKQQAYTDAVQPLLAGL